MEKNKIPAINKERNIYITEAANSILSIIPIEITFPFEFSILYNKKIKNASRLTIVFIIGIINC